MRVLIIGTGAVGISLSAGLARAGAEVTFFARGQTLAAIRAGGVRRTALFGGVDVPAGDMRSRKPSCQKQGGFLWLFVAETGKRLRRGRLAHPKIRSEDETGGVGKVSIAYIHRSFTRVAGPPPKLAIANLYID